MTLSTTVRPTLPSPSEQTSGTYQELCLAKTSYTCRMNDLAKSWIRIFPLKFLP
jgi:hypothetical protein